MKSVKDIKVEVDDYYVDKVSGLLVFTEKYHIKRGYCCKSGCRHCPYNYKKDKLK